MKPITASDQYHPKSFTCAVPDCERHYCKDHRHLWRDCDTAEIDFEGSGRAVWMLGDPPCCLAALRLRRSA